MKSLEQLVDRNWRKERERRAWSVFVGIVAAAGGASAGSHFADALVSLNFAKIRAEAYAAADYWMAEEACAEGKAEIDEKGCAEEEIRGEGAAEKGSRS